MKKIKKYRLILKKDYEFVGFDVDGYVTVRYKIPLKEGSLPRNDNPIKLETWIEDKK